MISMCLRMPCAHVEAGALARRRVVDVGDHDEGRPGLPDGEGFHGLLTRCPLCRFLCRSDADIRVMFCYDRSFRCSRLLT